MEYYSHTWAGSTHHAFLTLDSVHNRLLDWVEMSAFRRSNHSPIVVMLQIFLSSTITSMENVQTSYMPWFHRYGSFRVALVLQSRTFPSLLLETSNTHVDFMVIDISQEHLAIEYSQRGMSPDRV